MARRHTPAALRIYPNLHMFFAAHPRGTQTQIARELGISKPLLSCIRWGKREPSLNLALRIVARCQVPLESLLLRPGLIGNRSTTMRKAS